MESPFFIQKVEMKALETMKRALQVTSATVATKRLASLLNLKEGHPLLVTKRIYFSKAGRALETAVTYFPGDVWYNVAELEKAKP